MFRLVTGHLKEAQFPFAVALAALAMISNGLAIRLSIRPTKPAFEGAPETVLATAVGYNRYEGMALVTAVD